MLKPVGWSVNDLATYLRNVDDWTNPGMTLEQFSAAVREAASLSRACRKSDKQRRADDQLVICTLKRH